jgi:nitrogen fixation protein NifZ
LANRNPHDSNELLEPPVYEVGQKVRSLQNVRNDGTYPGPAVGEVLIPEGAVGYVISIGSYLQMYHIYSVDFFEQRRVIGMRAKELEMVDAYANAPQNSSPIKPRPTKPHGAQS